MVWEGRIIVMRAWKERNIALKMFHATDKSLTSARVFSRFSPYLTVKQRITDLEWLFNFVEVICEEPVLSFLQTIYSIQRTTD